MTPIISLTTDFGRSDHYVGVMHGVILNICPSAQIVDLCHHVSPQDVREAAFTLYAATPYFAPESVHVVVVDPGVGSARKAIGVSTDRGRYVAPDNGVLSLILEREEVRDQVWLNKPDYWLPKVSQTFHGRDIFAPVGAHLASGVSLPELGEPLSALVRLPSSSPQRLAGGVVVGEVWHVDHFGNLITNIPANLLADRSAVRVEVADVELIGVAPTYAAVAVGELLALIGSVGHLEVAVRNGNAAARLNAEVGTQVSVYPLSA